MPVDPAIATSLIGAGSDILGAEINAGQSRRFIREMNEYNKPLNQLARLREAGLPFAAFAGNAAGNQSLIPQTSGQGYANAGNRLSNFFTTKTQLVQLDILKEEARLKRSEANKNEAMTEWLLSGKGTDRAATNLTAGLSTDLSIKQLQQQATEFANKIAEAEAGNIGNKIALTNTEQGQRIANMIQDYKAKDIQISGYKLDNALKQLELKWRPRMNAANLDHILKQNDILVTEKGLKQLQYNLDAATYNNKIRMSDIETETKRLGMQLLGVNYEQSRQWQEFNRRTQKLFLDNPKMSISERANAIMSMIYQTIGNPQGKLSSPIFNFSN